MAAALLSKACCMRVCTSPGRPLHGQEVSVPTCPAAPRTPFSTFLKAAMQKYPLGYSCAWWIVECAFRDSVRWAIVAVKLSAGNFLGHYACILYSVS